MAAEEGFYDSSYNSAVGSLLPGNNLQTINQVTHQSHFQKKTKENFVGCVEILHEEIAFFLQIGVYLPVSTVVLAVGSELFVSC
jgi:hypothetical protein